MRIEQTSLLAAIRIFPYRGEFNIRAFKPPTEMADKTEKELSEKSDDNA